ncbi:MAG: helix-turn-helix transcriptional regulator [Faecalibacterium prausnitzii]|nr:helix-turn-helix transcriptional regulator [Faecalibacterium prausnitzii]
MGFKERLKEKRLEAGLTQVELAGKAGVTTRTIQNYELGNRKPANMEVIQRIADALNTIAIFNNTAESTLTFEQKEV